MRLRQEQGTAPRGSSLDGAVEQPVLDAVAVGSGPFNLGLAALASNVPDLSLCVLEARSELRWHAGLMFDDALLQSSFLADLVTLVDPTHPLSFLAYLRDVDRLIPFFLRGRLQPTRREYEAYLRWAAEQLATLRFGHRVDGVAWDERRRCFSISVAAPEGARMRVLARDLVLGIGNVPSMPQPVAALPSSLRLHASEYLTRRAEVDRARHVTVIGSGQSAAEIVLDLLRRDGAGAPSFTWLTRSGSFAQRDDSTLARELTTPAYASYFHGLPAPVRDRVSGQSTRPDRGIAASTLAQIHELLYQRHLDPSLARPVLSPGVTVEGARKGDEGEVLLACRHRDGQSRFTHATSLVIAATGYKERAPAFLQPLEPLIRRDSQGRYRVGPDYAIELDPSVSGRVFVANAEQHTHGSAGADLGMGAYRSASILNALVGRPLHRLPQARPFTTFAPPSERAADAHPAVREQEAAE